MRRRALAFILGAGLAAPAARGAEYRVAVVVAATDSPPAIGIGDLAQIYRRRRHYVGERRVQPANLPPSHALRRFFSQQVLERSPEELEAYWRDQYFNGVFPPFVVASEEAMLRFVSATPGAIGYVSACALDRRVSAVLMLDGGPACTK